MKHTIMDILVNLADLYWQQANRIVSLSRGLWANKSLWRILLNHPNQGAHRLIMYCQIYLTVSNCYLAKRSYIYLDLIHRLIYDLGCDVNRSGPGSTTVLHVLCKQPFYNNVNVQQLAHVLLNVPSINPNVQDYEGDTPLHLAIKMGNEKLVKQLIKMPKISASLTTKNKMNECPVQVAFRTGQYRVLYHIHQLFPDHLAVILTKGQWERICSLFIAGSFDLTVIEEKSTIMRFFAARF